MLVGGSAMLNFPVWCVWCPVMDWSLIQSVFLPYTQCSWDRLRIHLDHDQDKVLTEDK